MKKAYLAGLLVLLLAAGCWVQLPQLPPPFGPTPKPTIHISFLTQQARTDDESPAICTDLPEGMELFVMPLSSTKVRVEVLGLQPGEMVSVKLIANPSPRGENYKIEAWPDAGVDGRLTITQGGLEPLQGNTTNLWTIKVVHARGVACQEITLPMP